MSTVQTEAIIANQPTVPKEEPTPDVPRDPPEGLDHSSFVTIWNNTDYQLQLTGSKIHEGKYVDGPPQLIDTLSSGNNRGFIKMEKKFGLYGTKGEVWYSTPDGTNQFQFTFACPAMDNNFAGAIPTEDSPRVITGPFDAKGDLVVSFSVLN